MGKMLKLGLPTYGAPTHKRCGIYAIVNTVNGKHYVGQSKDLESRRQSHRADLENGKHGNAHLLNSYRLYGATSFAFVILEYVHDLATLNERERHWIETMNTGVGVYNVVLDPDKWQDYVSSHVRDEMIAKGYLPENTEVRPDWHSWVYGHGKNPHCRR